MSDTFINEITSCEPWEEISLCCKCLIHIKKKPQSGICPNCGYSCGETLRTVDVVGRIVTGWEYRDTKALDEKCQIKAMHTDLDKMNKKLAKQNIEMNKNMDKQNDQASKIKELKKSEKETDIICKRVVKQAGINKQEAINYYKEIDGLNVSITHLKSFIHKHMKGISAHDIANGDETKGWSKRDIPRT